VPKAPKLLVEPPTEDEIKKLFGRLNTRTKIGARGDAILLLFLDTGIPCSELCSLSLGDVHLDKDPGWIEVRGKGDKERNAYVINVLPPGKLTSHLPTLTHIFTLSCYDAPGERQQASIGLPSSPAAGATFCPDAQLSSYAAQA
jgi:Phage integrase family